MYKKIMLLSLLLFFVGGCATFKPLTPGFHAKKNASIAVISGRQKDNNLMIAHYVTEALKEKSKYRVLPQASITKAVKGYPFDIHGPYGTAYLQVEKDYTKTDVKAIRQLQKKLGVDYLFVIWAPISVMVNGTNNLTEVITQLFEFPGAKEVGRGGFRIMARKVTWSFSRTLKDSEIEQGIKAAALKVAGELATLTAMAK